MRPLHIWRNKEDTASSSNLFPGPVKNTAFTPTTHLSIIWGVTLAVITLIEWHNLDRDPLQREIISPFIERSVAVAVVEPPETGDIPVETGPGSDAGTELRYEVEFNFNGPLFLAAFFIPVAILRGMGAVVARWRKD